jgi:putative ABC transport system permease protein
MRHDSKQNLPPRWAVWILKQLTSHNDRDSFLDDLEIEYSEWISEKNRISASIRYILHALRAVPELLFLIIEWRFTMFKNYIKIALRNLLNHKLFSLINVFGLATGIAICMIITLWVQRELSYDRFHTKSQRIYRIERELFRDNLYSRWPITSGAYKQALIEDYPEIEEATRFWRREFSIKDYNDFIHRQELFAVDNSIFKIFNFTLEKGDPNTALIEPMTLVLTRENALKYFGILDVIGKSLSLEWNGEPTDFKITGILQSLPHNSHIQFDMLMSINSYPEERFTGWRSNYLYTYVLVNESTSKSILEDKLKTFVNQHLEPHYGDLLIHGHGIHEVLKMELFPITDIHLNPSVNWELEPGGNKSSVYIFSSIAVLILIIACINFMTLSTARANKRAVEVGLRKTVGAYKGQLRIQFIQESILLAFLALLLSLVFIILFIPIHNQIFNESLSADTLLQLKNILILFGITLTVGFLAGLYPAFYLTKFDPVTVLKGGMQVGKGKSVFRRNMVILQFIISITLITGMFMIYKQMIYIQKRSLGFEKENVVLLPVRSRQIAEGYNVFRDKLLQNTQIVSVAASADLPGDPLYSNGSVFARDISDDNINMIFMFNDYDYIDTYRMEIIAGRNFSRDFKTDTAGTMILNEAAAKRIGWTPEEAVGKKLDRGEPESATKIVGVVKDFNFKSLHLEVEPAILILYPEYIRAISVRIIPTDIDQTMAYIENKWMEIFPGEQFQFGFLDERINQLYLKEIKIKRIFIVFTGLSILVACLGLFGLAAFIAEERTKEIGVRKVMGATVPGLVFLLSKGVTKWILIATGIAWPIAYIALQKWLQNFAYRANIPWWIFILAGMTSITVSLFTLSWQAIRAARANPIESLRYE